jgi:hypothetical protein
MKMDKEMIVLKENLVPDGMGGFIEQGEVQEGRIFAFITPVSTEVMLKEHGVIRTTALKIFTKEILPDTNFQIEYAGRKFEILQIADYGKVRMLLIQEIEENE